MTGGFEGVADRIRAAINPDPWDADWPAPARPPAATQERRRMAREAYARAMADHGVPIDQAHIYACALPVFGDD
jgi:hypothetical protein